MTQRETCPSCGYQAGSGDTFCPGCGKRIVSITGSGSPAGKPPGTNILASISWTAEQFARYDRDIPWQKKDASPASRPADPTKDTSDERGRESVACRTCGGPLEPGRKFCISCGKPVEAPGATARQVPPAPPPCPACGRPADPGDRFCEGCGADRARTRPPTGSCPRCGAKNPAGRKFCGQCGAPIPPSRG